jgi:hypothetical protein
MHHLSEPVELHAIKLPQAELVNVARVEGDSDERHTNEAKAVAERQIVLAGYRLADVLRSAMEK